MQNIRAVLRRLVATFGASDSISRKNNGISSAYAPNGEMIEALSLQCTQEMLQRTQEKWHSALAQENFPN
ncbi:hypothetical protein H9Q09_11170 [Aurantimonas sp. DM33-3]|uniref:hypothetical protein n=1 Tax=Aurantimonas sp. DM33-3 TaxID=2766955 RepID=UPI001652143D|nr:hypothetical protein [Aurantimonas sp. DM33-3]MBC6716765.1 hypothetical protein [Aurantimonas sp. DM33-3]